MRKTWIKCLVMREGNDGAKKRELDLNLDDTKKKYREKKKGPRNMVPKSLVYVKQGSSTFLPQEVHFGFGGYAEPEVGPSHLRLEYQR